MTMKSPTWLIIGFCALLPFFSMAQSTPNNYTAAWKKVDSLISKGLSKSALTQTNLIYTRARQEKNDAQIIKSLIYRDGIQAEILDDPGSKTIAELEKELPEVGQPARSILQNILANEYWRYFQQRRYVFYNRTATKDFKKDDIDTWSTDDFHKKIDGLFIASLQNEKLLTAARLDTYDAVIVKGNVRALRPTLFDLLANDALGYFESDERYVNQPGNAFEINDPAAFADAAAFAQHRFKTTDSLSTHYRALLLQQRLIAFHLGDAKPDALLDIDFRRLKFAHTFYTPEDKDERYQQALEHITNRWGQLPAASEAWYLLAKLHSDKAQNYTPGKDTANRYEYIKAKEICDKVIAQKDSSEGRVHCLQLLNQIKERSLTLQIENVNMPDEPMRMLVSWRNLPRLYGRIVRIDKNARGFIRDLYQDGAWQKLLQLPLQRSFAEDLPRTDDYQMHSTEIKIDALPIGEYALIACPDSNFRQGQQIMTMTRFYVSAIAYINKGPDFFVLHRGTGQPLAKATAQVWDQQYDYKASKYTFTRQESYHTDQNGHFRIAKRSENRSNDESTMEITAGSDHLFIDARNYFPYPYKQPAVADSLKYEKEQRRTFLFMDRSIYRPGQTVYFKGIVVTRDFTTHNAKIIPSLRTKLILYDANRSKVDSMEVTTNEYGSYHGSFQLPANLLNGEFSIADDQTKRSLSFSVEEYKRPLFYVSYDTLRGSYRVGDTIRVKGSAKAYAGNVIDGAAVTYRVVREVRYPCFDCWPLWGRIRQSTGSREIAHGTAKTNAGGGFTIAFPAIPDKTVDKAGDPIFTYTVSADVTDINGETRSESTQVQAGYKSLTLSVDLPADKEIPADSLHGLQIGAANLSGTPEPTQVNVTMYALKAPDRLIREREWEKPDQFTMSKDEFLRNFPHDEYADENNMQNWEKTTRIMEKTETSGKTISLPGSLSPGWYIVEATAKDKDGQTVKTMGYIHLYDGRTGDPGYPQYDWPSDEGAATVQPGEKVKVNVGSSAENVFVIRNIERISDRDSFDLHPLTVSKGSRRTEFPVTEADRGGFGIYDVFVKDNRFFTRQYTVSVPWTNKELTTQYDTWRDKVLPGSEEHWKITLHGQRKDKVAAEALAAMYDASLDQFRPHSWSVPELYDTYYSRSNWDAQGNFTIAQSQQAYVDQSVYIPFEKTYDRLTTYADAFQDADVSNVSFQANATKRTPLNRKMAGIAVAPMAMSAGKGRVAGKTFQDDMNPDVRWRSDSTRVMAGEASEAVLPSAAAQAPEQVQIRKNFTETAFFFPDLRTDDSGSISFSFTMPEALTRWKAMILAHTKDLAFGYSEKTIVTQKQLMIQPNVPRFLREGDRMELSVKIVNLSDSEMTGQIELQLIDPTNGQTADGIFSNRQANQYFTVAAGQSSVASFPIDVPYQYNRPLIYRLIAKARSYSDGEEAALPVVSNRMLVTESLPLNMSGDGTKEFHFDKLLRSGNSETLNHHALTVEFTSNPAWYAVQALPYLMEYPYECAEQTFNRFYANAIASSIINSTPRIKAIFEKWRTTDTAALLSNLEKNQELKSVLLQETPWVLEGKSESQQKQHIALLFDMVRMSRELTSSLTKLQQMQSPNGGFVWFKGGPDDRYITQYILTGIGRLRKLNAIPSTMTDKVNNIISAAMPYLDGKIKEDYAAILREQKNKKPANQKIAPIWIGELPVEYLYMRSFFNDMGIKGDLLPAISYFRKQAQQQWLQYSKYMQGMIALALFRTGDVQTGKNIIASLRETSIRDEEKGMYWRGMEGGYYWWQAPIETQSLLIEAFHEVANAPKDEAALKTWLLRQKQTHNWSTTKATADACYALLMPSGTGSSAPAGSWLTVERNVDIRVGSKLLPSTAAEAGTGYFKQVVDGSHVQPSMGNITVTLKTANTAASTQSTAPPAWGAVYWQYFENLDKITAADNTKAPLKLVKKLFIEKNTDRGPVLEPVAENGVLHPGDKVKVRIELYSDRDLEYVHMKDMRAACMEPTNVLSQYKWQGGLGYYESTKDASTDFFFSHIPKGSFVFEYPLFVGQKGNFSNGVTSIECMYAPEFSFHSEGIRVNVEEVTP